MYKTFIVSALFLAVYFTAVNCRPTDLQAADVGGGVFLNCSKYPDKAFVVTDVEIPGCSGPPCKFERGKTATVKVTFKTISGGPYKALYAKMCGDISITCANLDLKDPNLCDLGAKCPINKGDTNTVELSVPVDSHYPKLTVTAYLYMETDKDDSDRKDSLGCFEVEISLE